MSPKLADSAVRQGDAIDSRLPPVGGGATPAEQGVPDPLVVSAGRDRAVLVHRPAAHRRVPDAVLRPVDGRGHLQRRVSAPARDRDVQGLRVGARHQLRGARRVVRPSGPPLGGADVRRGDHGAPGPHLLHRRLPAAPRSQLGDRLTAADPGHVRGLLRLLAARRPALGHRPARGAVIDHAGHPADRHLAALGAVRRRLSRRHPHPAPVLHPHPDLPGHHAGAHRYSPGDGVVPEAHPVPRSGPHRNRMSSVCASCRCSPSSPGRSSR